MTVNIFKHMTLNIFKHMTLNIFKHMTLNIFKHMTVNKLTKTVFMTGKNQLNGKVSLFGLKVKIVEINEGPFGYLSQKSEVSNLYVSLCTVFDPSEHAAKSVT